jgi:ChrR-like protein with cupin domain
MKHSFHLSILAALLTLPACSSDDDKTDVEGLGDKTVLDLSELTANPDGGYDWFDFRPNVQKLILAGDEASEHVAILWYTVTDGMVGLHYHSKTESVYVIDGTQTDAKGVYPSGTVYFNPPGSGHQIMNSSGFFILAYASPPDFMSTDLIEEYTPVRIETGAMSEYTFEEQAAGVMTYDVPLVEEGGMSGRFFELSTPQDAFDFTGNYVLVLEGSCDIGGVPVAERTLVVTKGVEPESFTLSASSDTCRALGVSF